MWEQDNHYSAPNRKWERESKMCGLVIVWTETVKDEEQIHKEKSVR